MTDQKTSESPQERLEGASATPAPPEAENGPQMGSRPLGSREAAARIRQRNAASPDDQCWPWEGRCSRKGYGVVSLDGLTWQAHRWSYEQFIGPISEGLLILHRCDNPPCVNPRHLRAGTHLDNMKDRTERKRGAQQRRTHCPQGHPYDEANTEWRAAKGRAPFRRCRTCKRLANIQRNQAVRTEGRLAKAAGAPPVKLGPGQLETLELTAAGLTRGDIAAALGISAHAVDVRRSEVYRKLRVNNKQEAVERARQLGLLPAHNAGLSVREAAADGRRWRGDEKTGEQ